MNAEHLRICSSVEWGKTVEDVLMPWVLEGVGLGDHLLEVGPGLDIPDFRKLHVDDICVPSDPSSMPDRLRNAGFVDVAVTIRANRMRFSARIS